MAKRWLRDKIVNWLIKESATAPVLISGAGGPQYTMDKFDEFAREVYLKNVIGYRCVDEIAKAVASVPWGVFKKSKEGELERLWDHPMDKLLNRTNPYESFQSFMLKNAAFLVLDGNCFIERRSLSTGMSAGVPMEMYSHRPDRMEIVVSSSGLITSYRYVGPSGKKIEWPVDAVTQQGDILHVKLFHPLNDWWGTSAVRPTSREIDTSNEATDWNMNLIQNNAKPGMVFATESFLTDIEKAAIKRSIMDNYSGGKNAGKNLLLANGKWTATPYQMSPSEMDFIEGHREQARRIALGFGVPPQLLGIPGDNTYSNYKEARLAFWESQVLFYLPLFRSEFNNWLPGEDETLYLDYILEDIPALEPRREEQWKRAQESDFLTINEKRSMVGQDPYEDGGDLILVSATMLPLSTDFGIPEEPVDDGTGDDGGKPKKKPGDDGKTPPKKPKDDSKQDEVDE